MPVNGADIIAKAEKSLGTKYVWGGTSLTGGVDCSGLVQAVFASFGIDLPRTTYDQVNVGSSVPVNRLQAGDLLFFDTEPANKGADHVGIYIGGGKFIQAPHTGDVVKISSLSDSYYMSRLMTAKRVPGVIGASGQASSSSLVSGASAGLGASVTKLSPTELASQYGMSYAFFKSQPELMKLLNSAVSEQWTPDVFTAHLKNTKWWKTNSDTARQAQVQAKTDPATYKASIAAAAASAQEQAVQAGAILSSKQVQALAKNMVNYNWNQDQVNNFLGQYVDFQANKVLGGQAGAAANQLRQYAYDQGVKISDQTVKNNAAYVVRGISTMQEAQDSLKSQAVSTYPGFADQIMAGNTMRDIAQPYIQMTAQELGLPETDVDVWHPKVQAALNQAGGKGQPSPVPLSDFQRQLRLDPAWARTQGAQDSVMQTGRQVLASMGLIA